MWPPDQGRESDEPRGSRNAVARELIGQLVGRARAEGLDLLGEDGLLRQLTKRVLESALEGEMADHLGYDKHDPAGRHGGNSCDGTRDKTVLEVGPVDIAMPRDRDSMFIPKIVYKRQRRLTEVGEMVFSCRPRVWVPNTGSPCAACAYSWGPRSDPVHESGPLVRVVHSPMATTARLWFMDKLIGTALVAHLPA
jgi:Transposase, Mutator family